MKFFIDTAVVDEIKEANQDDDVDLFASDDDAYDDDFDDFE